MQSVKRLEIVVGAVHERTVERLIDEVGIDGFTLTRGVAGHGQRGQRNADGLTHAFENVYFVVAAPQELAERLIEGLRPLLKETGGMCLVSEALWVRH